MGMIKYKDIAGVNSSKGLRKDRRILHIFCSSCMLEPSGYAEDEIILRSEAEKAGRTYWCDWCKKAFNKEGYRP